jgi:hypothetical protein
VKVGVELAALIVGQYPVLGPFGQFLQARLIFVTKAKAEEVARGNGS